MFDYAAQLVAFHDRHVKLTASLLDKLYAHRQANRDRLASRIEQHIAGLSIGSANFRPQGSAAIGTIIKTKFAEEEYDIDDGVVLPRARLKDANGFEIDAAALRSKIQNALKDARFNRQPKLMTNCVRVFYANEDAERHHVDFPVYRESSIGGAPSVRELASVDGWVESDPTQVNRWFADLVTERNATQDQWGAQLRRLIRLLKRFCRSRRVWLELLPNGMKLTMLVAECQPPYDARLDVAFRNLLERIEGRLQRSKVIKNLAHPDLPELTRTSSDANVIALLDTVGEARAHLLKLESMAEVTIEEARKAWDWIFQSDGFFESCDDALLGAARATKDTAAPLAKAAATPWAEPAPWAMQKRYDVKVSAQHSLHSPSNKGWRKFESGAALSKGVKLRFQAVITASAPYDVFWQVVNTGEEARREAALRGEIVTGNGELGRGSRDESTKYAGRHWVECFVVQNGICVGRSGAFFIVVQ